MTNKGSLVRTDIKGSNIDPKSFLCRKEEIRKRADGKIGIVGDIVNERDPMIVWVEYQTGGRAPFHKLKEIKEWIPLDQREQ